MSLRDKFGMFMLAKTTWLQLIMIVEIGEALGLLAAMDWVNKLVFERVIFCLDSKAVVDSFISGARDNTELGSILARCRVSLSDICNNSNVELSEREANMDTLSWIFTTLTN
jgi:hypothetical protein